MKKSEEILTTKKIENLIDNISSTIQLQYEDESIEILIQYLTINSNLKKKKRETLAKKIFQSFKERAEEGVVPNCIIFRKEHKFKNIQSWDSEVYFATMKFLKEFTIYPNILILNPNTIAQIDMLANNKKKQNIKDKDEKSPKKNEFVPINGFQSEDFSLAFSIDESISNGWFALVYDSDPDWDGGESIDEILLSLEEELEQEYIESTKVA
jgi:hypothetical protein